MKVVLRVPRDSAHPGQRCALVAPPRQVGTGFDRSRRDQRRHIARHRYRYGRRVPASFVNPIGANVVPGHDR